MSKVKQAIETAIAQVNIASRNTYGAKIYSFEQVILILDDLLETASEDSDGDTTNSLTMELITCLVGTIDDLVTDNIDNMCDSDIIDEDTLEASISGGRVSIEGIDLDKSSIVDEATSNLERTILEWAQVNGLYDGN
jgi:hypothetical protein